VENIYTQFQKYENINFYQKITTYKKMIEYLYMKEKMAEKNFKKFYNNLRKNEWSNTAKYGPSSNSRYRIMISLLKKYNCEKPLLDIGCGIGVTLQQISKIFPDNLFGSDFSSEAITLAKQNFPKAEYFNYDLMKSPSIKYQYFFKTVICSEVLEHVRNVDIAIKNISYLMKNDGYLIITVPYLTKNWTSHDDFSGHLRRFEKNDLEDALIKNNFRIIENFSWGWLIYEFYYKVISQVGPKKLMKNNSSHVSKFKTILAKIFTEFLFIEYLLRDKSRVKGRRLFIIAQKN
jgi:2-polyprenyl-3-methyl-5-hydroxy-6-metoxy-1,4-benzoquinol methylase